MTTTPPDEDLAVTISWHGSRRLIVHNLVINNAPIVTDEEVDGKAPLPQQVGVPKNVATASDPDAFAVVYDVDLPAGSAVDVTCRLHVGPGVTITQIDVKAENRTTQKSAKVGSAPTLSPGGEVKIGGPLTFNPGTL
jgi:hypothetical protein